MNLQNLVQSAVDEFFSLSPKYRTKENLARKIAEVYQYRPCPRCDGDGWYPDHDKGDPHENGCSNCPVQEQCELCRANGWITVQELDRILKERRQAILKDSDPLPF